MSTTPTKNIHRNKEQWQSLVAKWQQSQLSAPAFCQINNLAYSSFCHWRKRLLATEPSAIPAIAPNTPAFIDLSTTDLSSTSSWHIVLTLGDGVELTLSRG